MATKGYLDRPGIAQKALQMLLEGKSLQQVATALSTKRVKLSRQAVSLFKARHADELAPAVNQMVKEAMGIAIANKRVRLQKLDAIFNALYREFEANGVYVEDTEDVVSEETGEVTTLLKSRKLNRPLLLELREYLRDAAEEMGQIPRWQAPAEGQGYGGPDVNVGVQANVDVTLPTQVIIVRDVPDMFHMPEPGE